MVGTYTIWLGKEAVGEARVERSGLYYCFTCCCSFHSEVICRVNVSCGGRHESLGIPVPDGRNFVLSKKLPVKYFPTGIPEFWITPKHSIAQGDFIEVYPEEPFGYIAKLYRAYLEIRRGQVGVVIKPEDRQAPTPRGNGRFP